MERDLELTRKSTEQEFISILRDEITKPAGLIIFGPDVADKDAIQKECVTVLTPKVSVCGESMGLLPFNEVGKLIRDGQTVIYVMKGESSKDPGQRRSIIHAMKNANAKSIVGIHVRSEPQGLRPAMLPVSVAAFNRQVYELATSPPSARDLDYLFTLYARGM